MNIRCWVAALAATSTSLVAYAEDKDGKRPPAPLTPILLKKDEFKPLVLPSIVLQKKDVSKPLVVPAPLPSLTSKPMTSTSQNARPTTPVPGPGPGGPGSGGSGNGQTQPGPIDAVQKYRVTLLGIKVNHQTRDDILENDGPGDEVIVRCWTRLTKDGVTKQEQFTGINGILGKDTARGDDVARFIRAGTANLREGGLRSGDSFPANPSAPARPAAVTWHPVGTNFNRNVADLANRPVDRAKYSGRFPLVVFEGAIGEKEVVAIAPTLWEWDDFGPTPFHVLPHALNYRAFWTKQGNDDRLVQFESGFAAADAINGVVKTKAQDLDVSLNTVRDAGARVLADQQLPAVAMKTGWALKLPKVEGDMGGNRGIGTIDAIDNIPVQFTAPKVLLLTQTSAKKLSELTLPEQAQGVIEVKLVDDKTFEGDYTIFLHIEKIR